MTSPGQPPGSGPAALLPAQPGRPAAGDVPRLQRVFQACYPGVPEAVRHVRRDARAALEGVPAAESAVYCLSEICTNAVLHSRSGLPGGAFTVVADVVPGQVVAVGVADQGGPWREPAADTYKHGLAIVAELAATTAIDGDDRGRAVWAMLPWSDQ